MRNKLQACRFTGTGFLGGFTEKGMLVRPLPLLDFFVVLVILSIGLRVTGGDLLDVFRDRALLTRTLLANCVPIPATGFLLVVSADACPWRIDMVASFERNVTMLLG
jgi:hypothetical protein